jgi:hypothetical protein
MCLLYQVGGPCQFRKFLKPYDRSFLDIRTLYILFILSFVDNSAASSVKSSFLEQRQDVFRSMLAGLDQDSYSLARRILEVAWTGIWLDLKIKRTSKVNIFNEKSLHHVRQTKTLFHTSSWVDRL